MGTSAQAFASDPSYSLAFRQTIASTVNGTKLADVTITGVTEIARRRLRIESSEAALREQVQEEKQQQVQEEKAAEMVTSIKEVQSTEKEVQSRMLLRDQFSPQAAGGVSVSFTVIVNSPTFASPAAGYNALSQQLASSVASGGFAKQLATNAYYAGAKNLTKVKVGGLAVQAVIFPTSLPTAAPVPPTPIPTTKPSPSPTSQFTTYSSVVGYIFAGSFIALASLVVGAYVAIRRRVIVTGLPKNWAPKDLGQFKGAVYVMKTNIPGSVVVEFKNRFFATEFLKRSNKRGDMVMALRQTRKTLKVRWAFPLWLESCWGVTADTNLKTEIPIHLPSGDDDNDEEASWLSCCFGHKRKYHRRRKVTRENKVVPVEDDDDDIGLGVPGDVESVKTGGSRMTAQELQMLQWRAVLDQAKSTSQGWVGGPVSGGSLSEPGGDDVHSFHGSQFGDGSSLHGESQVSYYLQK